MHHERRRRTVATLAALGLMTAASTTRAAQPAISPWADGDIVLVRHADAPGFGDPPAFALGDCATQRNLDDAGREQARRIGEALRSRGARVSEVWTSQWCRCRDTARLAFPDRVAREVAAFNSFFAQASQASPQTEAARDRLRQWAGPGVLVVVTHQVNITSLTGVVPGSGEGLVLRWQQGQLQVVARLPAPQTPARATRPGPAS